MMSNSRGLQGPGWPLLQQKPFIADGLTGMEDTQDPLVLFQAVEAV